MHKQVFKFIRNCVLYNTSKPNNMNLRLYTLPLTIPNKPWGSASINLIGGVLMTRHEHDYLFIVVYKFNKMFLNIPFKNKIKGQEVILGSDMLEKMICVAY